MRIKRLELSGFKSFVDKTVVELPTGISAVVGPNGCGKSNIVDAIRWVLGEQSYKTLRGSSMEDVIFNGSDSRAPTGMAEVQIIFDNSEGRIGGLFASHSEIAIGRRLFRSGESEYLINRSPARLKDIQDIFMDTGVGARAHYAIIEQGKIGLILAAKPEDRRLLIEEAAGISKYRSRKDAALRKLESTQQNLLRIQDVVAEVKRQIDYMARQAQKARKYAALKEESQVLETQLWKVDYREQHDLLAREELNLSQLQNEESVLRGTIDQHETQVANLRLEQVEAEKSLQEQQERLFQLRGRIEVLENSVKHFDEVRVALEQRREVDAEQMEALREQAAEARGLKGAAEENLDAVRAEDGLIQERLSTALVELEELGREFQAADREQEELRERISNLQTRIANGGTTIDNLDRRRIEWTGRMARSAAEMEELAKRLATLKASLQKDEESLLGVQQLQLELRNRAAAGQESVAELSARRETAEKELASNREELATLKSRMRVLQELQDSFEGVSEGARFLLQKREQQPAELGGVFGLVSDVITLPREYERAAEAALGERLQYIVVKSHQAGVQAVDYLNVEAGGRSTFIPMEIKQPDDDGREVSGEGVVGPLLGLVRSDPDYERIVRYLFGNFVVVDTLPHALDIWARNGIRKTLVTLEGEVLDPYGVVSGGKRHMQAAEEGSESDSGSRLARKRTISELAEAISAGQDAIRNAESELSNISHQLMMSRVEVESLQRDSHEEELRVVKQQKEVAQIRQDFSRGSDQLRQIEQRRLEEERELREVQEEAERVANQMTADKEDRERAIEALDSRKDRTLDLRRSLETLKMAVTDMQVRAASLREQKNAREVEIARLQSQHADLERRSVQLMDGMEERKREESDLAEKRRVSEQEIGQLVRETAVAEDDWNAKRQAHQQRMEQVEQSEGQLRRLRREEEALQQRCNEARLAVSQSKMRMENLVGRLREQTSLDPDLLMQEAVSSVPEILEPAVVLQWRDGLNDLRRQLAQVGEVNLSAIQELDDLTARHLFLVRQKEDLERSIEVLQKTIQKVNRTSRERFKETFDAVNEKFQEVFPRLFGGGRASLMLTNEEDLLTAGVDILCQPPGKKIQNVVLLSGGEKALASICLVLAIFLIRPSPFCLLDEVDAPLDDANIFRFNELLREIALKSQLILITHNRNTMEIAQNLYGVTMQEPGVSRLVSVRMN